MPSRPGHHRPHPRPGPLLGPGAALSPRGSVSPPQTLPEKEASSIQGSQTRLRAQTLQLHLFPCLASVLVIPSINLASHAWALPPITRLDETHPLARQPSWSSELERTTRGCVRATGGGQLLQHPCAPRACLLPRPASLSDRVPLLKNYSISTTASQNFAFLLHKDHESHKRGTMRSPPPAAAHTLGHSRTGSSTPSMRAHKSPPTLLPSGSLASGLSLTAPKRSTSCLHGILPISTRLTVISHFQNCPPPPHPSALSQGDAHFTLTSSGSHIPLNPQHTAV